MQKEHNPEYQVTYLFTYIDMVIYIDTFFNQYLFDPCP